MRRGDQQVGSTSAHDVTPARRSPLRRGWVVTALATAAAAAYVIGLQGAPAAAPAVPSALLGAPPSTRVPSPPPPSTAPSSARSPSDAPALLPFADPGPDRGEAQAALDARAASLRGSAAAALPVTELSYDLEGVTGAADGSTATARATLRYRLRGEPAAVQVPVDVTLRRVGPAWRASKERTTGRPLPWEVGRPTVAAGRSTTAVGIGGVPGGRRALQAWADLGDRVSAQVGVLVHGWTPQLTLVVPPDSATLARLTGRDAASVDRLAGLALAEPVAAGSPPVIRVYLNTTLLGGASGLAREIVLRHEVTHVALGAPATSTTPTWLEEGAAEYLGYQGSGVPLRVAARDLLARAAAGRVPQAPPTAPEFAGPRVGLAYQAAHLLVATMVDQVGVDGMLRVYRRTARDGELGRAWREVSGSGWPRLLAAWQARTRTLAG